MYNPGSSGAFSLAFLSCFESATVWQWQCRVTPVINAYWIFWCGNCAINGNSKDKYQPTVPLLKGALEKGKIDGLLSLRQITQRERL